MKKQVIRAILITILTLILIVGASWYIATNNQADNPSTPPLNPTTQHVPTLNPDTEWKEFTNVIFKYSLKYPVRPYSDGYKGSDTVIVHSGNDYATDYTKEGNVYFSGQGMMFFDVSIHDARSPDTYLSLQAFAERKRHINIQDKARKDIKEKIISDIEEYTVAGKKGYSFLMNDSYATETGGHLIAPGQTYRYIFLEQNGNKVVLSFPYDNPISQQILSTFQFE